MRQVSFVVELLYAGSNLESVRFKQQCWHIELLAQMEKQLVQVSDLGVAQVNLLYQRHYQAPEILGLLVSVTLVELFLQALDSTAPDPCRQIVRLAKE